jgi:hypothetical protein
MKVVLEKEAYAQFDKDAKALGLTSRELAADIINDWIKSTKK